jgi:hypothetical protein
MYELVLVDRAARIDPLFGDFAVLVRYMRFSTNQASAIQWLAIAAHLIFAMSCLVKHPLLKTYLVTELLIAVPSVYWASPAIIHGSGDVFGSSGPFFVV